MECHLMVTQHLMMLPSSRCRTQLDLKNEFWVSVRAEHARA